MISQEITLDKLIEDIDRQIEILTAIANDNAILNEQLRLILESRELLLSQEMEIFADAYGGHQEAGLEMWQFRPQNLARVAEAMGCLGIRVEDPAAIRPALERALASGRPAVVDVASDIEALAPQPWTQ